MLAPIGRPGLMATLGKRIACGSMRLGQRGKSWTSYEPWKRIIDIVLSVVAITLTLPLMVIIAVAVKLDSHGPILYKPLRSGMCGKPFKTYKFRTMIQNAEQLGEPTTALNDPRVTRVGSFLRKYKLDEIPQFFNVLGGTMSFVGPRPEVIAYTDRYRGEEEIILSVLPGITDFSSVKFHDLASHVGDSHAESHYRENIFPIKNQLRIRYVKERSFSTDIKILIYTVARLLGLRINLN